MALLVKIALLLIFSSISGILSDAEEITPFWNRHASNLHVMIYQATESGGYGQRLCAGTLMTGDIVLTAASCLVNSDRGNLFAIVKAYRRKDSREMPTRTRKVLKIYPNSRTVSPDVAVLFLAMGEQVSENSFTLNLPKYDILSGSLVKTFVWATSEDDTRYTPESTLMVKQYELKLAPLKECEKITNFKSLTQLCAKISFPRDVTMSQLEESRGGAVIKEKYIIGIVSAFNMDAERKIEYIIITNVFQVKQHIRYALKSSNN